MGILLAMVVVAFVLAQASEGSVSTSPVSAVKPAIVANVAWTRYDAIFKRYASQYGVSWLWLKAFSLNESVLGTDPLTSRGAVSSDGKSWGIMQVTLATAIDLGAGPIEGPALNDPDLSVRLAAKLVRNLKAEFGSDTRAIVMSYNEGPGNFKKGRVVEEYWARWQRNLALAEQYS